MINKIIQDYIENNLDIEIKNKLKTDEMIYGNSFLEIIWDEEKTRIISSERKNPMDIMIKIEGDK